VYKDVTIDILNVSVTAIHSRYHSGIKKYMSITKILLFM